MTSEELDALSEKYMPLGMIQFEALRGNKPMTPAEEHAFACGWDWAIETVRTAMEGKG